MATADEVIVKFTAQVGKYEADLKRAQRSFDNATTSQAASMQRLEKAIQRSSGNISATIRGLGSTLATYFTGRELVGLLDSFTRLQNNLRVAGIEGDNLKAVQDRLFASAQKYGVGIEDLSQLFSSLSQASKDLGATQEQVFTVTDAVSASLKVMGISATSAGGSLLQLKQLFQGNKVQAQEYNSLIDSMYPLLQAVAAGSDRWKGSVGALTRDVKASSVTTREFFDALLKGSDTVLKKAEGATLTLSGGFTTLTNALTVYFGEADKANGVSAALGEAMRVLAENLDTIIPALAIIGTAMGVTMVGSAVAGSRAFFALAAAMGGAATGAEALAFAFAGLEAVLPLLAITALIGAVYLLDQHFRDAEKANGAYAESAVASAKASDAAGAAAQRLATAHGQARVEALAAAKAEQQLIKQKIASAKASLLLARAELARAKADNAKVQSAAFNPIGIAGADDPMAGAMVAQMSSASSTRDVTQAQSNAKAAEATVGRLEKAFDDLTEAINAAEIPAVTPPGDPSKPQPKKDRAGPSGPSPEEIAQRFYDESVGYAQQTNSNMAQLARNAEDEAEYSRRNVELARVRTLDQIDHDKDYSATQKERLRNAVEVLVESERQRIEFQRQSRLEDEATALREQQAQTIRDALQDELDLADTRAEQRDLAHQIVAAEAAALRAKLEGVIASQTATDAEKERARLALANLDADTQRKQAGVDRQYEGPLARYARGSKDIDTMVQEAAVQRIEDLNETIADTMAKALGIKDPFLAQLLKIFLQKNVFGPLAEALAGDGEGLGGLFKSIGSAIAGLFGGGPGRAIGGPVRKGRAYMVGENGPEPFIPQENGMILPNRSLVAQPNAGGGRQLVMQVDARGAVMNDEFARLILRQAKGYAADAGKASYTQSMRDAPKAVATQKRYEG